MSGVRVSVIVPTHNGETYLRRALASATAQDGADIEVLVVDDASTDSTPEMASEYGPPVRHVRLEKQRNHIAATNIGIALAKGDYVSVLHHDDYYLPGKLRAHVQLMDRYPQLGFSYSAQHYVGPEDEVLATLRSPVRRSSYVAPGRIELRHLAVQNYINFCNAVFRRSVFNNVGPFPEDLWWAAEWVTWARLALCQPVGYIDEILVCYRVHREAITLSGTRDTATFLEQLRTGFDLIWSERGMESVEDRRRLSVANIELTMAMLYFFRSEPQRAAGAVRRLATIIWPWELPALVHSSALLPRVLPRVRLLTKHRHE